MAKSSLLPAVAIVLGIVLLAAALVWPALVERRSYWSEAQAQQRAEAGVELKVLPHELENVQTDAQRQQVEALVKKAREKYDQIDCEFERAKTRFDRHVAILRWSGTFCLVVGVGIYYALRGQGR